MKRPARPGPGQVMRRNARLSEDSIVDMLGPFAGRSRALKVGIGDDAAVLRLPGAREHWVVTSDLLLEGVDFRRNSTSPGDLGHKALAANLSDLAAMGARPRFYTVSLGLTGDTTPYWISRFYQGMTALGRQAGAELIGGDLSGSPQGVLVSITAIGETRGRRCLLRSGGRPGDALFVTGTLGLSAAGLHLLEHRGARPRTTAARTAIAAHRTPTPRNHVGLWLAQSGLCSAMMDLSDGLSTDLARLCRASGTGAEIEASRLPCFPDAAAWGCDPIQLALHGGEDFELLFAAPDRNVPRLISAYPSHFPPISAIGRLTERRGLRWRPPNATRHRRLERRGWDHFAIDD